MNYTLPRHRRKNNRHKGNNSRTPKTKKDVRSTLNAQNETVLRVNHCLYRSANHSADRIYAYGKITNAHRM